MVVRVALALCLAATLVAGASGSAIAAAQLRLRPDAIRGDRLVFRMPSSLLPRIQSGVLRSGKRRERFSRRRLLASTRHGRLSIRIPAAWRTSTRRYVLVLALWEPRVGSLPRNDAEAAAHVTRSSWEPRRENADANGYRPGDGELASFYGASDEPYTSYVTGRSTLRSPTTDELIQWAAWKWGIDPDIMRAVAAQESEWHQSMLGDYRAGPIGQTGCSAPSCPTSFGITQIKDQWHDPGHGGSWPLSQKSTAFNLDYYGRWLRSCYDGKETWLQASQPHDLWGCIGAWYSGGWYDSDANGYIASVKKWLANRTWMTY